MRAYYDLGDICEKRDQKFMITLEARCSTTAMGIVPHRDVEQAPELALSLDIPTPGKSSPSDFGDNLNPPPELPRFLHWLPLQKLVERKTILVPLRK